MSNFKVWIDDVTLNNVQTAAAFSNDNQRKDGFKAGTAASAIRVNTALRQANLIAVALVESLGIDTTLSGANLSVESSLNDVKAWLNTVPIIRLNKHIYVSSDNILPFVKIQPADETIFLELGGAGPGEHISSIYTDKINGFKNLDNTANVAKARTRINTDYDDAATIIEKRQLIYKGDVTLQYGADHTYLISNSINTNAKYKDNTTYEILITPYNYSTSSNHGFNFDIFHRIVTPKDTDTYQARSFVGQIVTDMPNTGNYSINQCKCMFQYSTDQLGDKVISLYLTAESIDIRTAACNTFYGTPSFTIYIYHIITDTEESIE